MLPRVSCEATRRAEERACHSKERLEVHFNEVVVDMWDNDWAMALHTSFLTSCLYAALAYVCEQVVRQLAVMLNGLGSDRWSTLSHAWHK